MALFRSAFRPEPISISHQSLHSSPRCIPQSNPLAVHRAEPTETLSQPMNLNFAAGIHAKFFRALCDPRHSDTKRAAPNEIYSAHFSNQLL